MKTFIAFLLTVKIDLVEVVHYLKLKSVFHLLSKLYDKSITPVGAITYL